MFHSRGELLAHLETLLLHLPELPGVLGAVVQPDGLVLLHQAATGGADQPGATGENWDTDMETGKYLQT